MAAIKNKVIFSMIHQEFLLVKGIYHKEPSESEIINVQKINKPIDKIPDFVISSLFPIGGSLQFNIGKVPKEIIYDKKDIKTLEKDLPPQILSKLLPFQKEGVRFGMLNKCRVLIADEMGVGKTIQAICLAFAYLLNTKMNIENKLLIICPSSLKYYWREEILKWIGSIIKNLDSIFQIFVGSSDSIRKNTRVLICSYDLINKIQQKINNYNAYVAIADEAHFLKSGDTIRSKAIVPYLQQLKHVILLTGTPAFARPKEMFSLVSILRPDIFKEFKDYGNRYCNPKPSSFHKGLDYTGSSNELELHFMLTKNMMIRRLKKDVLSELPAKKRRKIIVNIESAIGAQIRQILGKAYEKLKKNHNIQIEEEFNCKNQTSSHFQSLKMCYQLSGLAKIKEVKNYLKGLVEATSKVIVFAEHTDILKSIEEFAIEKSYKYIRIDGSVQQQERQNRVKRFEENSNISLAILSYGAASQGFTLTSASNILFAEMHWTPAIMQQAEDRAHRIGQMNPVICHYIIGQDTLDSMLYKNIEQKLQIVGTILDGKTGNLKIDEIKDVNGRIELVQQKKEQELTVQKEQVHNKQLEVSQKVQQQEEQIEEKQEQKQGKEKKKQNIYQEKILQEKPEEKTEKNNISEQDNKKQSSILTYFMKDNTEFKKIKKDIILNSIKDKEITKKDEGTIMVEEKIISQQEEKSEKSVIMLTDNIKDKAKLKKKRKGQIQVEDEKKKVIKNDEAIMVEDKGIIIEDKGIIIEDKGIVIEDEGFIIEDEGIIIEDQGIIIEDKIDSKQNNIPQEDHVIVILTQQEDDENKKLEVPIEPLYKLQRRSKDQFDEDNKHLILYNNLQPQKQIKIKIFPRQIYSNLILID